jgi:hypothetical protein
LNGHFLLPTLAAAPTLKIYAFGGMDQNALQSAKHGKDRGIDRS